MRHGKKFNHLGRQTAHRAAMLSNMACSLIEHKRINTTIAKAKALRVYVEPILTKSKDDTTHARRTAFSYLKSKEAVTELFRTVAPKIADRPGGYTRIIRTGYRLGDNAEMCLIELVDFNELMLNDTTKKATTRRSRRGGAGTTAAKTTTAPAEVATEEATPEAVVVEETTAEVVEEAPVTEAPAAEEAAPEATEEPSADEEEKKDDQ
ncbi:MAG: 50S ribosomal protein L17 [Flavobacteriia bacterium]|nr:50S ribosomal protein L17 [Flavobacteriia bacterium]